MGKRDVLGKTDDVCLHWITDKRSHDDLDTELLQEETRLVVQNRRGLAKGCELSI